MSVKRIYVCDHCGKQQDVTEDYHSRAGGSPSGWWTIYNGRGVMVGPGVPEDSYVCSTACAFAWCMENGPISSGTINGAQPHMRLKEREKRLEQRESEITEKVYQARKEAFHMAIGMVEAFYESFKSKRSTGALAVKTLVDRFKTYMDKGF